MEYKRYPTYKESGADWLGGVPEHWRAEKLKYIATFSGGGTPAKENLDYWDGSIPWVSPKDMKSEMITDSIDHITPDGLANSSTKLVNPGAVLLVARSGILRHTVPVGINDVPVSLNQDMKALTLDERKIRPPFLLRWVQGLNHSLRLAWAKQGATVESLEHDYVANSLILLPDLEEQDAIVAFLDRETTRIDALIEKKQRLIELLMEKRQAVITQAVTKGLDPNVPMKDSGVEWLGEVPGHWGAVALGYRYEVVLGKMLDQKRVTGEHLSPYLRNVDVQWDRINTDDLPEMDFSGPDLAKYALRAGDLLVCEGGDVGRCAIWYGEAEQVYYQKALHRLRPYEPKKDNPRFLMYVLWNASAQGRFISGGGKATIAHLTAESLRRYVFVFPERTEQDTIVSYLDGLRGKYEAIINKTEASILLLQEHRSALITAAVTGQIDVRNAA